jgi:NAD-dependent dihydropyrimidine dehydrogenase PreA subunit
MKHRYLKNVQSLVLLSEKCIGCGKCTEVCPHSVFSVDKGKAIIKDKNSCIECGACANNCPVSAVNVEAGVGCAYAVIMGWLTGKEATCDCGVNTASCC